MFIVHRYYNPLSKKRRNFQTGSVTEKLKLCVVFIANPFLVLDIGDLSGLMAEFLCVGPVEIEMEVIKIQNDVQQTSFTAVSGVWQSQIIIKNVTRLL